MVTTMALTQHDERDPLAPLREALARVPKGGLARVARQAETNVRNLYRIRDGETEPGAALAARIAEALGAELPGMGTAEERSRYVELPLLRQVAGGHPRADAREPLTLAFRRDWLASFLGRPLPEESPEEVAYLVRVKGDSMAPAIRSGDVALCQRWEPAHGIKDGALYLLHLDGGETVKRVQARGPSSINAYADNPAAGFPVTPIDLEGRDAREVILARVRWHAHKEE